MNISKLFIIIPAYNEERSVGLLVKEIKSLGYSNVVVVDDGSVDGTEKVSVASGARVIKHNTNIGQGAAVRAGIEFAKDAGASHVLMMDGDGQFVAEDIAKLISKMEETHADIVLGSRFIANNPIPLKNKIYNIIANYVSYFLSRIWFSDSQTGFRLLGPKAVSGLGLRMDGYEFCTEMIMSAHQDGLAIAEVPVTVIYFEDERIGKGQGFIKGIGTFFKLISGIYFP